jgi:polyhydroxyalkanoate synthesis regulator phasin
MPYDLYGQYYASERDAINAEMAQCAEIDARLSYEKAQKLERELHERQMYADYESSQKIDYLMSKIEELEKRIAELESGTNRVVLPEGE